MIELLRELIRDKKGTQNILIDKTIKDKMDEGPKRIRPPSREELLIELRLLGRKFAETEAEYLRLNPAKLQDIQRHKDIQVDMGEYYPEDQMTEFADETGFLEDFNLSRMGSMAEPNPAERQNDKERRKEQDRRQQIEKLAFMVEQEKLRLKSME